MEHLEKSSDFLVIGGGVIGLACAYELSLAGASVTVIDKGELGHGCSYGNAGWITPCFALPLPLPGRLFKSIQWLSDPESPLYIRPQASLLLLRWLTRFLLSMNQEQALRSVRALTEISKFSLEVYAKLSTESGKDFAFEQAGLLMLAQTQAGIKAARQELDFVSPHGIAGVPLNADEVHDLEPAISGRVLGGMFFPNEAHAEPLLAVQALAYAAEKHGTRLIPGAELIDFQTQGRRIELVRTTRGLFRAKQIVLATGSWSHSLAKALRLSIPVLGGKGYALITEPLSPNPLRPLMLIEKKIAITPRQNSLRIAGTLELVNENWGITPRRVDAIVRGARECLRIPDPLPYQEIWRGLRPCTPDGVPIIDFAPGYQNLFLATGHQMLGLQSAPATGRLAADLLLKRAPTFDPTPFRATRF